jgi:MoaA/NifB/PqqE/SkfB family radical SAM enzyme
MQKMNLLFYRNYGRLWRVYGRSLFRYGSPRKVWNALRTEIAYRRRQSDVRSAPYILFLEPLYYCNLDCPLCDRQVFPEARKGDAGRLSLELYDKILDEIGDYLFQCQIFGQGEPMLDWKLTRRIIERSHQRRIFTLVSTNCTLITQRIAEEVVSCGLDHLVCAIDGISQETYEIYRAGGQYEDAMNGMKMILEERRKQNSTMEIEWQYLVHQHNLHQVEEAKKMAKDMGVYIRFAPLRGMEWDKNLEDFWLPSAASRGSEEVSLRGGTALGTSPAAALAASAKPVGEAMQDYPCYFLWRSLVLNSNGKVARCLIYQNVSQYANLKDMPVLSAYNHPSVQRARELFRKSPAPAGDAPAPCAGCSYFARHHGNAVTDRRIPLSVLVSPAAREDHVHEDAREHQPV